LGPGSHTKKINKSYFLSISCGEGAQLFAEGGGGLSSYQKEEEVEGRDKKSVGWFVVIYVGCDIERKEKKPCFAAEGGSRERSAVRPRKNNLLRTDKRKKKKKPVARCAGKKEIVESREVLFISEKKKRSSMILSGGGGLDS